MALASPLWLLALPVALLLPWLLRGPALPVAALSVVRTPDTWRTRLRHLPPMLGALGLGLLVLALARPQEIETQRRVVREGVDIILALDTSGSMSARAGRDGSRLEIARAAIASFIDGRPDDRIGLVVFGEDAHAAAPLTLDHDALRGLLDEIRIGVAGRGATAIGDAIAIAGRRLDARASPGRVLVLLTDGRNNAGQLSPLRAAQAARTLGIRVHTIGFSAAEGAGGGLFGAPGRSDLDASTLREIARITGGRSFQAADAAALSGVYAQIDALEKSPAEIREHVRRSERFRPVLLASIALLLCQAVLGQSWLRRLP